MDYKLAGKPSFTYITINLEPGDSVYTESNAMLSMDADINHNVQFNGGILHALLIKFFGQESLFMNTFTNTQQQARKITLSQGSPGDIRTVELRNSGIYVQPGAFIACTGSVRPHFKWAGFKSWFAGEGLFRLYLSGTGTCWYGAYGGIFEYDLDGEYIVDTSHLVSYPDGVSMHVQLAGSGLISSFLSREGFVTRLKGKGKVYLQSRSISGLASVINRFIT